MAGFRKAKAEQAALKLGLYGPAGSGKTFTSLLFAEGIARLTGRRVAVADTEHGTDFYSQAVEARKVHPAAFDFDALYTRSLTETIAACKSLDTTRYGVVVIDSISHIWEAAIAAYSGKKTSVDTIPFQAWGIIKRPYKELMSWVLSTPMHAIICGRQKNVYGQDDNDELKCIGVTMRAEGETPYEPHILGRMECIRAKKGEGIVTVFVEKDRTGVHAGKVIPWPNFENFCQPLLGLLGETQAAIESEESVAAHDAENLADVDRAKAEQSESLSREWSAKIDLCKSAAELKAIGKALTPPEKAKMLPAHVAELRERYQSTERKLGGAA